MKLKTLMMSCMVAALAWNLPARAVDDNGEALLAFEIVQKVERIDLAKKTVTAGGRTYVFRPETEIRIMGGDKPVSFSELKESMVGWRMGVGAYETEGGYIMRRAYFAPPEKAGTAKGTVK